MTYYNEVRNDILEAIEINEDYIKEVLEDYTNAYDAYDKIYELIDNNVTGNIDGSYYCNRYKARQQVYNFSSEVIEALENCGYTNELERFKLFEVLVDEGYVNLECMSLNEYYLENLNEDEKDCIIYDFEEISDLDFEVLDVITRSYYFYSLLYEILEEKF